MAAKKTPAKKTPAKKTPVKKSASKPAAKKPELSDGKGTLLMAILSLLFFLPGFSLFAIPALIDSVDQKKKAREAGVEPNSRIKASFVIAIVSLVVFALAVAAVTVLFTVVMNDFIDGLQGGSGGHIHKFSAPKDYDLRGTY